jgi:hypothetical protein
MKHLKITTRLCYLLIFCLISCFLESAEQDHFYGHDSWSSQNGTEDGGLAYYFDSSTEREYIYVADDYPGKVYTYDINGTLIRESSQTPNYIYDIDTDEDGNLFAAGLKHITAWDKNGNLLWQVTSSGGSGDGDFQHLYGIAVHPLKDEIYVTDVLNDRIQIFNKNNGNFIRKFGSSGSAPGEFSTPRGVDFNYDGTFYISSGSTNFDFFSDNDIFINRITQGWSRSYFSRFSPDGRIATTNRDLNNQSQPYFMNMNGEEITAIPESGSGFLSYKTRNCWTKHGDWLVLKESWVYIYKRTYRTKGLPEQNLVPLPKTHKVTQRTGTNVIDLDYEILDPDDSTASVGLLAAVDGAFDDLSKWVVPSTFAYNTGNNIGPLIATNTVHRVSWNVKSDWAEPTGNLKLRILCQDARRSYPTDLHFLRLPFSDSNLTISRSPIKDPEMICFFQYLVATGSSEVSFDDTNNLVKDTSGNILLQTTSPQVTETGRTFFIQKLGHRWATSEELTKAREAASPGNVNKWEPVKPIQPRNLPYVVNEFSFDTGDNTSWDNFSNRHGSRAWWVVKE